MERVSAPELASASAEDLTTTHKAIFRALEAGQYLPKVALKLELSDAYKAHKQVMEDGNCGKIVLIP